jgi:toxin FitB
MHITVRCSARDALIAATALVHRMTIVTRNVADFEATGAPIINPWQA